MKEENEQDKQQQRQQHKNKPEHKQAHKRRRRGRAAQVLPGQRVRRSARKRVRRAGRIVAIPRPPEVEQEEEEQEEEREPRPHGCLPRKRTARLDRRRLNKFAQ